MVRISSRIDGYILHVCAPALHFVFDALFPITSILYPWTGASVWIRVSPPGMQDLGLVPTILIAVKGVESFCIFVQEGTP